MTASTKSAPTHVATEKMRGVLDSMPEPLQEVAKEMRDRVCEHRQYDLLYYYDNGKKLNEVAKQEAVYGSDALTKLAFFLGLGTEWKTTFDRMRLLARVYSREKLQREAATTMADGHSLSLMHFIYVANLPTAAERDKKLKDVRARCLSSRELALELESRAGGSTRERRGGAQPTIPEKPMAAITKLRQQVVKVQNLIRPTCKSAIPKLVALDDETQCKHAREALLQLRESLMATDTEIRDMLRETQRAIEHADSVLGDDPEDDEDTEVGDEDAADVEDDADDEDTEVGEESDAAGAVLPPAVYESDEDFEADEEEAAPTKKKVKSAPRPPAKVGRR